jgi:Fic family protein
VSRCEALEHEKKGRVEEAAALWASLGEQVHEARCRAILHFRRSEFEAAAREYERAGHAEMATTVRKMSAERSEFADEAARPRPAYARPARERQRAAPSDGAPGATEAVLAALRQQPGLTCEEIAGLTRMTTQQVKPVLTALTARGLLAKTGRARGTRYHPSGSC